MTTKHGKMMDPQGNLMELKKITSLSGEVRKYRLNDSISPLDNFYTATTLIGDKYWFKGVGTDSAGKVLGILHREDGPAIIRTDGSEVWCVDGRRHRLDGPAIRYHPLNPTEYNVWWINGYRINSLKVYQEKTGCSDERLTALMLKWGKIK